MVDDARRALRRYGRRARSLAEVDRGVVAADDGAGLGAAHAPGLHHVAVAVAAILNREKEEQRRDAADVAGGDGESCADRGEFLIHFVDLFRLCVQLFVINGAVVHAIFFTARDALKIVYNKNVC